MDWFFKAEGGAICEYDEIRPRSLYRKPFYREDQKDIVDIEARKFLFYNNQDWASVKCTMQGLKRSPVQVSSISFSKETPFKFKKFQKLM